MHDSANKRSIGSQTPARPTPASGIGSSDARRGGGEQGTRLWFPRWLPRAAPFSTALVIMVSEGFRLLGSDLPLSLALLFASVVFSASVGGTRGALISGVMASAYVAAGFAANGFGPVITESPAQASLGLALIFLLSLLLGRLQDHNGVFYTAIRDEVNRRYRSLIRNAPEAICVLDFDEGRMIDGNPHALDLFEMDYETFTSTSVAALSPETQPGGQRSDQQAAAYIRQALREGSVTFEWWHRSASGRVFPCEVSLSRLPDERRSVVRGSVREITERKLEEMQRNSERKVLASMASGEPLEQTLDILAHAVERLVPDAVCTILLLRADGLRVSQGAGPSVSEAFRSAVEGAEIGPEAGSCGPAMFLEREIISSDILEDPKWTQWRAAAEAEGFRACWSQPIFGSSARVVGSFALYFREVREPSSEQRALVSRMSHLAGIAIERFRDAEALRHREALYRATFEHAAVGIAHLDADGRYIQANRNFCSLLGYDESELQLLSSRDVTHPDDVERDDEWVAKMISGEEESYHVEKRYLRKDGSTVWVNLSAGLVRKDDGSVERFVVVAEDVSDARRLSEELSYQAQHDALTGLINRNEFDRRLREFLERVVDGQTRGAVCYLDLDQFKLVNDTAGHVAGDEVLRQLGPELQQQIRGSDVLARLGGDEFGILLRGCTPRDAVNVADKLRRAVEKHPFVWGDKTFKLGVSVGVVPLTGDSLNSVTEVLQAADTVCYVAKDSGRNRVVVWREDDESLDRRHGEMQWVPRLNKALEDDLFSLVAQPIVALSENAQTIDWYEVLVRLDDTGEPISPGAFLPAAERYGIAPKLDQMVVGKTLRWLRCREKEGKQVSVSVNLSGLSFGDDAFRRFLFNALGKSLDLAPRICFEITETAAISNLTEAASLIESIRGLGSRIALDDFGSGLSSFAYLKALPVDYLKIDGAFVRDIADDPIDRALVRSIHEVGRVMGKETIAEFVESESVARVLKELNVDYAQGFWLGRPVPIEEIEL
jgi:diguanylate cyclase (GGDEF)-like protein/PAS domain S-box-containing protein